MSEKNEYIEVPIDSELGVFDNKIKLHYQQIVTIKRQCNEVTVYYRISKFGYMQGSVGVYETIKAATIIYDEIKKYLFDWATTQNTKN